jgi:hypothetical protein
LDIVASARRVTLKFGNHSGISVVRCRVARRTQPYSSLAKKCEKAMFMPIAIFMIVLSPLFIPLAVTALHARDNWRHRRVAQRSS